MRHKLRPLLLMGIAILFTVHTNAQTIKKGSTTLTGTVIGADGKPVPHAAVSCQSSGGVAPHAVHTDANGRFFLTGLKQDNYDLRASAYGANSEWHRNIPIRRGQTKDVTLRLLAGTGVPSAMPVKQGEETPQQ